MRKVRSLAKSLAFIALGLTLLGGSSASAQRISLLPTDDLPLVPIDQVPITGTFWLLDETNSPPLPFIPYEQASVYAMPDGSYLVDSASADQQVARLEERLRQAMTILSREYGLAGLMRTESDPPSPPGGGGDGSNTNTPPAYSGYPTNSLWLEMLGVTNNVAYLTVHGTVENMMYEILSKQSLDDTGWLSEGTLPGAAGQNWTPAYIVVAERTNLFLRARSFVDGDGNGLPDWWEQQYFGTNGVDPYLDLKGDGWTVVYKYQHGLNPWEVSTPAPPTGLAVAYVGSASRVQITWNPCTGLVSGYTIERYVPELDRTDSFAVNPGTAHAFLDSAFPLTNPDLVHFAPATYRIKAHYPRAGASFWSQPVSVYRSDVNPMSPRFAGSNQFAVLSRGLGSAPFLAVSALPRSATNVRIIMQQVSGENVLQSTNWVLPASTLTNGVCSVPSAIAATWRQYREFDSRLVDAAACNLELLDAQSNILANISVNGQFLELEPYQDGREQLKQNLSFFLRAADTEKPFSFTLLDAPMGSGITNFSYSPNTNYIAISHNIFEDFHADDGSITHLTHCDPYLPFRLNHLCRNFVFSTSNVDTNGYFVTGAGPYDGFAPALIYPPSYFFQTGSLAAVLAPSSVRWTWNPISYHDVWSFAYYYLIGLSISADYSIVSLDPQPTNFFGLPIQSVRYLEYNPGTDDYYWNTLYPGGASLGFHAQICYAETQEPNLVTWDYYFGRPNNGPRNVFPTLDPLPGQEQFSAATTTNALFIQPWNQPVRFAGYAKQVILNGDHTKSVYLGQYFDKAYRLNEQGTWTETGVLSEYGEFLPTEPGLNVLFTKPDLTQADNRQGQCPIHVIKLQLDVNHDGIMDLSFGGPDNTFSFRPFTFWVNNDYDRGHTVDLTDYEQDDLASNDSKADCPFTPGRPTLDCEYRDVNGSRVIPSERDLEDFTRLWICGVTTNLLSALPPGSTVTLSWGDVGSPNPANPTIDLFQAFEAAGGTGYLTNITMARLQTNASICRYVGRLGPGQSIQLNSSQFPNSWAREHLIWCGVSNGTGGLTLTISQGGTNTLAQTSAYIQLQDIKLMYERWSVGDNGTMAPTNNAYLAVEDLPPYTTAFQYGQSTDPNTPYILHVHGWNMQRWEKDRFGEAMFKRLYWQGYQGRFGIFRWPTLAKFPAISGEGADLNHFDKSEQQAWKSGQGLRNLLAALNAKYPGQVRLTAHSMGNVVAGEALRTNTQLAAIYVAMQGAVPAGAYDLAAPFRAIPYPYADGTTELYRLYPVFSPTRPYFYQVAGAGVYIDFYNPLDWALNIWLTDQNVKPADTLNYSFDGSTGTFYQNQGKPTQRVLTCPTNTYELFAYCVEGQCWALGAQINVGGVFDKTQQLDLNAAFGFGGAHKGHSGQFRSTYMAREPFWNALGSTLGVLP